MSCLVIVAAVEMVEILPAASVALAVRVFDHLANGTLMWKKLKKSAVPLATTSPPLYISILAQDSAVPVKTITVQVVD